MTGVGTLEGRAVTTSSVLLCDRRSGVLARCSAVAATVEGEAVGSRGA